MHSSLQARGVQVGSLSAELNSYSKLRTEIIALTRQVSFANKRRKVGMEVAAESGTGGRSGNHSLAFCIRGSCFYSFNCSNNYKGIIQLLFFWQNQEEELYDNDWKKL